LESCKYHSVHEAPCKRACKQEHHIYCPPSIQGEPREILKENSNKKQQKKIKWKQCKLVISLFFPCSQCNDTSRTSTQKWWHEPNNSCLELESGTKDFLFCSHRPAAWLTELLLRCIAPTNPEAHLVLSDQASNSPRNTAAKQASLAWFLAHGYHGFPYRFKDTKSN